MSAQSLAGLCYRMRSTLTVIDLDHRVLGDGEGLWNGIAQAASDVPQLCRESSIGRLNGRRNGLERRLEPVLEVEDMHI